VNGKYVIMSRRKNYGLSMVVKSKVFPNAVFFGKNGGFVVCWLYTNLAFFGGGKLQRMCPNEICGVAQGRAESL
jgi:hypothetical protein